MTPNDSDTIHRQPPSDRMAPPTGHDPKNPDMSPEAIAARLNMVEQLRRLCVSLRQAGRNVKSRDKKISGE